MGNTSPRLPETPSIPTFPEDKNRDPGAAGAIREPGGHLGPVLVSLQEPGGHLGPCSCLQEMSEYWEYIGTNGDTGTNVDTYDMTEEPQTLNKRDSGLTGVRNTQVR